MGAHQVAVVGRTRSIIFNIAKVNSGRNSATREVECWLFGGLEAVCAWLCISSSVNLELLSKKIQPFPLTFCFLLSLSLSFLRPEFPAAIHKDAFYL